MFLKIFVGFLIENVNKEAKALNPDFKACFSAVPEEHPKVLELRTPFVVKKQKDKNGASEQTCCLGSGFFLQVLEVLFDGVEGLFPGQAPAAAATASFGVVF